MDNQYVENPSEVPSSTNGESPIPRGNLSIAFSSEEEIGPEMCSAQGCCNEPILMCDNCDEPLCKAHIAEMDILALCEECNGLEASKLLLLKTQKHFDETGELVCMECHKEVESECDACNITNVETQEEKIVCDECVENFDSELWHEG